MDRTKSSATQRTNQEEKRLAELEERYRHELMDAEERQQLRDEILKLKGGCR